jgi:predicted enzyme related to lactoylglutathione lyase
MTQTVPRGRFVWHELMTTDPNAAIGFYTKVVGWTVQPFPDDPSYRMWAANGVALGGVMELPQEARNMGAQSHWLPYVAVPDIDATVRQATALGARTYVPPTDIIVGRFAILADPQGAIFAIFKPKGEAPGHDGAANVGEFSWHELLTSDARAAWDFYHALFGWEKTTAMDMGAEGTYQMFGRAGTDLGGMYNSSGTTARSHWLCYVRVPNVDAGAAAAAKLGGRVTNGPMEVPGGGRIAMCADPQGAAFAVHSVAQKKEAGGAKPAAKPAAKKKAAPARKKPAPAKKKVVAKARKKVAASKKKSAGKKKKSVRPKARVVKKKAKVTRKAARRPAAKRVTKKGKKSARHR